jgi:hypothetical protein
LVPEARNSSFQLDSVGIKLFAIRLF